MSPKYISEILIYFHEICLHVIFKNNFKFHLVNFLQSRFVNCNPCFHNVVFSASKGQDS